MHGRPYSGTNFTFHALDVMYEKEIRRKRGYDDGRVHVGQMDCGISRRLHPIDGTGIQLYGEKSEGLVVSDMVIHEPQTKYTRLLEQ